MLYVFSTSTPFEPERGYSKFSAYTLLEHGNDYAAAARELVSKGYGKPKPGFYRITPPVITAPIESWYVGQPAPLRSSNG